MIKRTLKFTLCALLLGAGVKAFADGEVQLTNGTSISWAQFVEKINKPDKVEGKLDPESKVVTNYNTADNNLKEAIKAQGTAENQLKAANEALKGNEDGTVKGAEAELTDAEAEYSSAQTAYTEASQKYNDAVGKQPGAQKAVDNLQAQIKTKYADAIADMLTQINTIQKDSIAAAGEVARYQRLMTALTKTTYPEVTPGWLTTEYTRAADFQKTYNLCENNWDGESDYSDNRKNYLYYDLEKVGSGRNARWELTLSFQEKHATSEGGWTKAYEDQFNDFLWQWSPDNENANPNNNKPTRLYIDLGSEYPENNGIVQIASYAQVPSTALGLCVDYLKSLNSTYKEKSETPVTTISDQELYDEYKASRDEYQQKITGDGTTENIGYTKQLENLRTDRNKLISEEKSDPLYTQLTAAQETLDGYNDTIEKYTATADADGKPYQGANGATVSYINYLLYQQTVKQNAVTTAQKKVTTCETAVSTAETAVSNAKNTVTAAQSAFDTAEAALEAAQKQADEDATAEAQKIYKDVTLTADVEATTPVTVDEYEGTINGNGNVITVSMPEGSTQTALFKKFSGTLIKTAINGTFAITTAGGEYDNVAVNTGSAFRLYDGQGKQVAATNSDGTTTIKSLGQLGYMARDLYGVDFTNSKLAKLADDTKVYSLSIYQEDVNATPQNNYVTYNGTALNGSKGTVKIPVNRFAKSATADIADCTGLENVYYVDEDGNTVSEKVVITEKNNFYCPEEIKANNLSYTRSFSYGYNVACLPFPMSESLSSKIIGVCTFDNVDMKKDAFSFTSAEADESVEANTPILVVANEDFEFVLNDNSGLTLQPTPKDMVVKGGNLDNGTSLSFGTYKSCNGGTFLGESKSEYIYGLVTKGEYKGKFRRAASSASFSPFRMVIASDWDGPTTTTGDASVRNIRIVNKLGVDITDELLGQASGVENVTEAATSLSIVGGQGAIVFHSDADYGKVEVYNVNGGLVTVADVMTGTTSVNVEKGIYIVMGKKVMVK